MKIVKLIFSLLFSVIFGTAIGSSIGVDPMYISAGLFGLSMIPKGVGAGVLAASIGVDFSVLTPPNGAVMDMRKILFLQTLLSDEIEKFHTVDKEVYNGEKLAGIGEFSEIGLKAGSSCDPTFATDKTRTIEKSWSIGEWEVAEEICYKDLMTTLAKFDLKDGSEIGDVQGTIITEIYTPLLEEALKKMFWRIAWFADTAAANVSGSGKITNGKDVKLLLCLTDCGNNC